MSIAGVGGARFTITNRCSEPIWPVVLVNATQQIEQYEGLVVGSSVSFQKPNGWVGSVWGKTGCVFNDSGSASCATGDTPGFTRAEFMLASPGYTDFYAVNLLDGFNLPLVVKPSGGSGSGSGSGLGSRCRSVYCIVDINQICPTELRTQGSAVCRSACEAFGTPENCCTGNYSEPQQCGPTNYTLLFKEACPTAYTYPYDDATATLSCTSPSEYFITFCPPSDSSFLGIHSFLLYV